MISPTLNAFLQQQKVHFTIEHHQPTFTAQESAEQTHTVGAAFAKTVMVLADGKLTMLVIPSPYQLDLIELPNAMGCETVELAYETQFADHFPDCETGAIPPFGNLFSLSVWVAEQLSDQEEITFCAGSYTDIIRMKYLDFHKLVHPKILTSGLIQPRGHHHHEHARMGRLRH